MTTTRPAILANDFHALWHMIRQEALGAVDRVGESGWLVLGQEVAAFEREVAAFQGLPFCVGTANGLDALEIALRCVGIRTGDLVLTTPLTAFATTLAIIRLGARPAYVDVDSSGLLDLDLAEQAIRDRPEIRAMVPVHLYGHALDVSRLRAIGVQTGVSIVEDCAQAIGARHAGVPVGAASRASITSFYPTKNLGALGDGGAVFAADEATRSLAANLRDYGQSEKYVHDVVGMNSRLDEVQAAVLRSALLPRLAAFNQRRSSIAQAYNSALRSESVRPLAKPPDSESVWHLFPVRVAGSRDAFLAHLKSAGIAAGIHYPILASSQRALAQFNALELSPLSRAIEIAATEVSLPIHPFLDDDAVARVIEACQSYDP